MRTSRRFLVVTCVLFAAVAFTSAAAAADEGMIYGCAQKNSGDLRIVDSLDDCRKSEVPVWWSQEGTPGEPGPPGPPGESANLDIERLADLLGQPSLAGGLPLDMAHPMECTAASLVFEGLGLPAADVVGMIGTDAVSQSFAYHVVVDELPADDSWVGQPGAVTFERNGSPTVFGGMITEVGTTGDVEGIRYTVVTLAPYIDVLDRRSDYRVYKDKNVPQIVEEVVAEADPGVAFELQGDYGVLACTVQYDESDLDFVNRLTEREGIFFYFDEGGHPTYADPGAGFGGGVLSLAYPGSSVPLQTGEEAVTSMKRGGWLSPDHATVRGYRPSDPAVPLDVTAGDGGGSREVFTHDASLTEGSLVADRAMVNFERLQVPLDLVSGTSSSADVRAGYGLEVVATPADELSGDYNVTRVTHAFVRDGDGCLAYGNAFEAVPTGVDYRPPILSPVPKVQGLHTAIVTGDAGEGRVNVRFIWDHLDESFCPVRVNQPAGTLNVGDPFIPPVGQEVLVGFVQGDPSQPIVLGSLFNGQDVPQ